MPCDEKGLVSEERMKRFLTVNDWGQPLDARKMKRNHIVRQEVMKPEYDRGLGQVSLSEYAEDHVKTDGDRHTRYYSMALTSDNQGRQLVLVRGWKDSDGSAGNTVAIVVTPGADGADPRLSVKMELTDEIMLDYTDAVKDFKKRCHWNEPV